MIDFHCHLDLYPDPFRIADAVQDSGWGVLSVTTTPSAWPGTHRLAGGRSTIRTALGLHPQLAGDRIKELALFERYLPETRFVGEVGLDGSPEYSDSWAVQLEVFEQVLALCNRAHRNLVSIHSRQAASSVLDCLDRHPGVTAPVLHWFSGTAAELRRAVDRGCWFSVGPAMLAGAKGRRLLSAMPQDRVVLETDGPFAHHHKAPLNPWDASLVLDYLVEVWRTERAEVEDIIGYSERSLLAAAS